MEAAAAAPRVAHMAKRGGGGGTRTHSTLLSRDFKSLRRGRDKFKL